MSPASNSPLPRRRSRPPPPPPLPQPLLPLSPILLLLLALVTTVHAADPISPSPSPSFGAPATKCSTSSACATDTKCIGLSISESSVTLRSCETNSWISQSCRCVRPPRACTSSFECNTGYLCLNSSQLNHTTYCVHCNYRAALGNSTANSIFSFIDTENSSNLPPHCTPSPSPIILKSDNTNNPDDDSPHISAPVTLRGGHTYDPCDTAGNPPCVGERTCAKWNGTALDRACTANDTEHCFCKLDNVQGEECKSSDDCLQGDRCVKLLKGSPKDKRKQLCASCLFYETTVTAISVDGAIANCNANLQTAATDDPPNNNADNDNDTDTDNDNDNDNGAASSSTDPDDNEVCIDVKLLVNIPHHQLVYGKEHRRAAVLCDDGGDCATPGHMVQVRGQRVMMMKTYCQSSHSAGCTRQVRWVNSMKAQPGNPLPSIRSANNNNLVFTALAARYQTTAEERILSLLHRLVHGVV